MKIKQKSLAVVFCAVMFIAALMVGFAGSLNAKAAEFNYFYGMGFSVKDGGYGSGMLLSADITAPDITGVYQADKIIYYTQDELPEELLISVEGMVSGFEAYLTYVGIERKFSANKTLAIEPTSSTATFSLTIKNTAGVTQQKMQVNIGFVKTDCYYERTQQTRLEAFDS